MVDIVNAFSGIYEQRVLFSGAIKTRNIPLDEAVKLKTIISYNRSSSTKRLFTWVIGFLQALVLIKIGYRQSHLFLVSNPPFASLLPLFCRNSFSLLIYDVYPDALTAQKILEERSVFVRIWCALNKKIFARASAIYTISEGMKFTLKKYAAEQVITVVPVWTDNTFLRPVVKEANPFLEEQGLNSKFVVLYSGNLGHTHDVEILTDLAEQLDDRDIFILIIGEGEKFKAIQDRISKKQMTNCRLLSLQPMEKLPFSLASADLAVVTLGKEASRLSVPSKTYNYMSVGAPILAIADQQSELAKIIRQYDMGVCHPGTEIKEMLTFIKKLKTDANYRNKLKSNSLKASLDFTSVNASIFAG